MNLPVKKLLLTYYGDDFTGSTDVMESLALNGLPTALFLNPPTPQEIDGFRLKKNISGTEENKLLAYGVAGVSRSYTVAQMDDHLPPIFDQISKTPSQFFQYKVCSTFDSSPEIGSIGHAAEIASKYFPSDKIPLLIGAPALNRFSVFGNLFARVGDVTYRLDRHPTMSKHPVTPMHESDLRIHLSHQTSRKVHLLDLFSLEQDYDHLTKQFAALPLQKGDFVLFDIFNQRHLMLAGNLIYESKSKDQTQLLVGSSGINYALTGYLQARGILTKPAAPSSPGKVDQLIVMAGSAAPTTKKQIDWVISKGFKPIRLDTTRLVEQESAGLEMGRVKTEALDAIQEGNNVVIFSAFGPDDPIIKATREKIQKSSSKKGTGELIASRQGRVLKELLLETGMRRTVVAGGDTSGYIARELGIYALETRMPIAPGAPLCTAHSDHKQFDGMEISLKGGQNGKEDYFESILNGEPIT